GAGVTLAVGGGDLLLAPGPVAELPDPRGAGVQAEGTVGLLVVDERLFPGALNEQLVGSGLRSVRHRESAERVSPQASILADGTTVRRHLEPRDASHHARTESMCAVIAALDRC